MASVQVYSSIVINLHPLPSPAPLAIISQLFLSSINAWPFSTPIGLDLSTLAAQGYKRFYGPHSYKQQNTTPPFPPPPSPKTQHTIKYCQYQ